MPFFTFFEKKKRGQRAAATGPCRRQGKRRREITPDGTC